MITKIFHTKEFAIRKYCHRTHRDKKNWDREEGIVKLGHPFSGRYVKMGQSRTWDGWGVQMSLKIWDVLYGCSHMIVFQSKN